ncbi:MAG: macro domain-containing protein [Acidimicrobiia bacterium]|nr:macro domain-containing protein [Acidimicrobiia bacterium]
MDIIAHRRVGQAHVFVVQGDLAAQPVVAIVNAANENLAHAGGVAAGIVGAGGRVIQEESDHWVREHGPVERGQAAVTTGGALQASHVIHVVGPRYRNGQDNEGMLRDATIAALEAATSIDARSVAFPAISAGIFGYPPAEATRVMASAGVGWLAEHTGVVEEVRLVGFDAGTARHFARGLEIMEEMA